MNTWELLGGTASALISKNHLGAEGGGQVRLLIDRLSDEQVAAICRAVLAHPGLAEACALRIPRATGRATGLPEEVLTDERMTFWRGRDVPGRRVLLLANSDDDQEESLKDLTMIGIDALLAEPKLWVATAAAGLGLSDEQERCWGVAMGALVQSHNISLDRFADYVIATRDAVADESHPLSVEEALGYALPALRAPRDRSYFAGLARSLRGQFLKWRSAFQGLYSKRIPYLLKRHPTDQTIGARELQSTFDDVLGAEEPSRLAAHQEVVERFIKAPSEWCGEALALASLDWEDDGVRDLFERLKKAKGKRSLGDATRDFYAKFLPDTLTDDELSLLDGLQKRGTRGPEPEHEVFYQRHRSELGQVPRLKAQWDQFVHGRAIETDDLRAGLLRAVERLFERLGGDQGPRTLTIDCHRRNAKQWEDVNKHAARYFALRYRGLPALFGGNVTWDPPSLFDDAVAEPDRKGKKAAKSALRESMAKAANQVKFTVSLSARGREDNTVNIQVIWSFDPRSISRAYAGDWQRLRERPFGANAVTREPFSVKGRLQSIDLRDTQTLMPVPGQNGGSLVARDREAIDARFEASLGDALAQGSLSPEHHAVIAQRWADFKAAYVAAVSEFVEHGTASTACLGLGDVYARLVDALVERCPSDKARRALWRPLFELGVAAVEGGDSAAIVAPWHPLRVVGAAVQDRRLGGLVRYVLREESVEFGDSSLFFRDLASELARPFYPEVCVGWRDDDAVLLARSDDHGEYSLTEPAQRGEARDRPGTNDDPRKAARVIKDVVARFLELYPHEAANLSLVLFNCDTVGLPEAVVTLLAEMYGDDEDRSVRCHVQLKHTDDTKLHRLYEALLESSARDVDSAVASEATRDFMAKLRVGIMASQSPTPTHLDGRPADIVFLQDVVARLSATEWTDQPALMTERELTSHAPSRWSRRRPSMRDDEHSTTDLCCPVQTPAGWSYLRGVSGLSNGRAPAIGDHPLPTRRVSFFEGHAKRVIDEAHKLGQWVVNFDEILTRQHLRNLEVRIIRHRQAPDGERGVIVSSSAPLTMLHTLVKRNLDGLGLPLAEAEVRSLAVRLVEYASEVSGDIVLRAARRSSFAHELIGVALSRYLLDDELGAGGIAQGWYFLDDYAEWLGQREGNIADVLALCPRRDEGGRASLTVLVSEAKYVRAEILQEQRSHSRSQARQTVSRMELALFDTPRRLDRDNWLGRLADLLTDSVVGSQTSRRDLQELQRDIAQGRVDIVLRGYSHVFVYAKDPDASVHTGRQAVEGAREVWQEVYGPDAVRRLLLAFHRKESPRAERKGIPSDGAWSEGVPRRPAEGANWATSVTTLELSQPPRPKAPADEPRAKRPRAPRTTKAVARCGEEETATGGSRDAEADGFAWASPRVAEVLRSAVAVGQRRDDDEAWLDQTEADLGYALRKYGLSAQVREKRLTPNVALIRLRGSDQMTVQGVERCVDKLLTTHGLRVIRVSAEPGAVVVSVARTSRELVTLPSVLLGREVDDVAGRSNQRLVVGVRESDGSTLYLDPGRAHAPHTLIAGATGSGKSVLLKNLLLDIAMTNDPSAARITLIDPKQGVDYGYFEALPHLDGAIIVERDVAIERLSALADHMDERYRRFKALGPGVENLADYNRRAREGERLPALWVVHDEFADWMLVEEYKTAVQSVVQRLGVKARAAGIRLIFAAQRPEDRVCPVQLRDNLGNRLILRVESAGTSVIALKEPGAEKLLGKGHLAASLEGDAGLVLAQVPVIANDTMEHLVAALRLDYGAP